MGKVTSWYGAEKLGVLYITFFADSSRKTASTICIQRVYTAKMPGKMEF
jgi:hypothetical protein